LLLLSAPSQLQNIVSDMLALKLALEHPALSTHPKVLCAAACACKAWREAVQQCSACNTDVVIDLHSSLLQLRSFSSWLRNHAGLVRRISISNSYRRYTAATRIHGLQAEDHYRTAFGLLQQALQTVAATAAQSAAAAAGALAGQTPQQQQQQQALRMSSYRSGCLSKPGAVGTLSALPAHSLRQLDLSFGLIVAARLMLQQSQQHWHGSAACSSCASAPQAWQRKLAIAWQACRS
jgi:hypothetical protein